MPEKIQQSEMETKFPHLLLPPKKQITKILDIDQSSPDAHVPRDERLIRLTGLHPFNCEPPLSVLRDAGYLTPSNLHFTRNHGPVPKEIYDHEWEIEIKGLVENPIKLDIKQIREFNDQITIPVTLVCAGNRRKEQNLVRKGNGFSWGSGVVGTSLFTGPMLWDVLKLAKPKLNGKFVCMQGRDMLPNGYYGTCVKMAQVKDKSRKIIIAHKMNGEDLDPDHGHPLRVIVPGVVAARSVKWLTTLTVTDMPSDNFYHIFDNRVLPTMASPQMVKENQNWWKDERYAIYDLNVQSVITFPSHAEEIVINSDHFPISGYAYSGGGAGRTWILCEIEYPEDSYREQNGKVLYGGVIDVDEDKCYTWCFWKVDVASTLLKNSQDIVVRAMDDGMNIQPRDMYWNVLSMLNNCWHRVCIKAVDNQKLKFEHPCLPALFPGGWMERVKANGGNLLGVNWGEESNESKPVDAVKSIVMTKPGILKYYTMEEVKNHKDDAWFVVKNNVYDGTAFLSAHPGGSDSILMVGGQDATEDFMAIHSESAQAMLIDYHIGHVDHPIASIVKPITTHADKHFLSEFSWKKALLVSRKTISHNTRLFRFKLENEKQSFGLPVGNHIFVRTKDSEGKFVLRAYTPISPPDLKGYFELLIKVYLPCAKFPNGGKMSCLVEAFSTGYSQIEVKGPLGSFEYLGNGLCLWKTREFQVDDFIMIAAGSGITPIFQVLRQVMDNAKDTTKCHMLNANTTFEDILLEKELKEWSISKPEKFKIRHCLNQPPKFWDGLTGYLDKNAMKDLPLPNVKRLVLICGPPGLVTVVKQLMETNSL